MGRHFIFIFRAFEINFNVSCRSSILSLLYNAPIALTKTTL